MCAVGYILSLAHWRMLVGCRCLGGGAAKGMGVMVHSRRDGGGRCGNLPGS